MPPRWTRPTLGLAGAAVVTAAFLRLWSVGGKSLWLDELFSVRVARRESWAGLAEELSGDVHPPLYFALLRLWAAVAGDHDALWRLPSAVAGIAAVAVTAVLALRLAGPVAGAAAAWIVAVLPMAVDLDREARGNSLLTLFCVAAAAVAAAPQPTPSRRVALAALCAAALWTHPFGLFFVLGLLVWIAADEPDRRPRALAAGLGLLSIAPWGVVLAGQAAAFADHPWYVEPSVDSLGWLWPSLTADLTGPAVLLAAAVAAGLAGGAPPALRLLLAMVGAVILLPQVVSYVAAPILRPRNIAPLVPIVAVAAASGLAALRRPLVAPATAVLVATLAIPAWRVEVAGPAEEQWREAAEALRSERKPGEPLYTNHPVLWWYYLGTTGDNQSIEGPLPDAAPTVWVLEGSYRLEAPVASLRARGNATEEVWRGAWLTRVAGLEAPLGPTDFGEEPGDGALHLYSGGPHRSRELRAFGACSIGIAGTTDAAAHGPALVRVAVLRPGEHGEEQLAEITVPVGEALTWSPPAVLTGRGLVELEFVNDALGDDAGVPWDRNANLTSLRLRCDAPG